MEVFGSGTETPILARDYCPKSMPPKKEPVKEAKRKTKAVAKEEVKAAKVEVKVVKQAKARGK